MNFLKKYGLAAASVTFILLLKLFYFETIGKETPVLLFYTGIILTGWYGGIGPTIFASILTSLYINYFLFGPVNQFNTDTASILKLIAFFAESSVIGILVSQMRKARNQLSLREKRFRSMIERSTDGIILLDNLGKIIYSSPPVSKILGYRPNELIGRLSTDLVLPEDRNEARSRRVLRSPGKSFVSEVRAIHKNGSLVWLDVTSTNLLNEPHVNAFVVNFRDITNRKEIEKRKDDFISIASHELKTPVTTLKIFAQILEKISRDKNNIPNPVSRREINRFSSKMNTQLDRLNMLISELLDVSKIRAGSFGLKKELFNYNKLVEETIHTIQATDEQHKITVLGKAKTKIFADKDRIYQVLVNYLTNAIKYSPQADKIQVKISHQDDKLVTSVKDFGIGIESKNIDKLFSRFFRVEGPKTESIPGMGMGLYISSQIIKKHDGKVWVVSEPGKGSTFYFSLPLKTRVN